jgi:multiple sugar transport system substrate-binding protein
MILDLLGRESKVLGCVKEIIKLKGITWDHPRGYEPLIAVSREFSFLHKNISIEWDVRTLKEFGNMPIENLIEKYDLITIDHPYMGQADENQLLLPLEKYLTKKELVEHTKQSVGNSFQSYYFKDHLYALPIDAAALVSASRKDLFTEVRLELPKTREDLIKIYKKIPTDFSIAWPLCSVDLWCTFLTLCAQNVGRGFIKNYVINESVGISVLDEIKYHLEYLHPDSINMNPINVLDRMSTDDEIIYSPYLFGYTNYSREGYKMHIVNFSDCPISPISKVSSILGGVGLAISSNCKYVNQAVDYIKYVADPFVQETTFTKHGGQPGNMNAWNNEDNNKLCNNFFKNTINTLQNSFVRPQHPLWNRFQDEGSDLLHSGMTNNYSSKKIMKDLNQLYKKVIDNG